MLVMLSLTAIYIAINKCKTKMFIGRHVFDPIGQQAFVGLYCKLKLTINDVSPLVANLLCKGVEPVLLYTYCVIS